MRATFLVTIDLEAGISLNEVADDIFDQLAGEFSVHEVKAWKRGTAIEPVKPVRAGEGQGVMPLPILPNLGVGEPS
jgi:hypothetical protein